MFTADLQWKDFNVDLVAVAANLKALYGDNFVAISAGLDRAQVAFQNLGSDQAHIDRSDEVKAYWEALTDSSPEALSYRSQAQVDAAKASAKSAMLSKSWDVMSAVERKLMLNLDVSKQELMDAGLL